MKLIEPSPPIDHEKVRKVELLISVLLRTGVLSSLAIVVIGTLITFVRHPDYANSPAEMQYLTHPGAAFPHTLRQVADGVAHLRGQALVAVGLLLLIATPVMRVAVSVLAFIYQRDWLFVILTLVVLSLLLLSFILGKVAG